MTTTALDAAADAPSLAPNQDAPASPPPSSAENPSGLSPTSLEKKKKKKKKKVRKPEDLVSGTTDEGSKLGVPVPSATNVAKSPSPAEVLVPLPSSGDVPPDAHSLIAENKLDAVECDSLMPDDDAGHAGADNAESTVAAGDGGISGASDGARGEETLDAWKARAIQNAGVVSDLKAASAKLRADLSVATQRATEAEDQEKTAKESLAKAMALLKEKESGLEMATREFEASLLEKDSALAQAKRQLETALVEKKSALEDAVRSETALKEKESALEDIARSQTTLKAEVLALRNEKKMIEQRAMDNEARDMSLANKERSNREKSEKKLAETLDALTLAQVARKEVEAARLRADEEVDSLRKELQSAREAAAAAAAAASAAAASAEASAASAADAGDKTVVEDASMTPLDNRAVVASSGAAVGVLLSLVLRAVSGGGARRND